MCESEEQTDYDRFLKKMLERPGAKELTDMQSECKQAREIIYKQFRFARRRTRYVSRTSTS